MQGRNIVRVKERPYHVPWYQDQRHLPHVQATYLGRLASLRHDLTQAENNNFSKAVDRVTGLYNSNKHSKSYQPRNQSKTDAFSEHQRRVRLEAQLKADRRRRVQSAPDFEPLKGDGISAEDQVKIKSDNADNTRLTSKPLSWEEFNRILNEQSVKFIDEDADLPISPSRDSERRTSLRPSNPFVHHIERYDKDSRGLYRGPKRRGLSSSGVKDHTNFTPDHFSYDTPNNLSRSMSTCSSNPGLSMPSLSRGQPQQRYHPRINEIHQSSSPRLLGSRNVPSKNYPRYILTHNASKALYLRRQVSPRKRVGGHSPRDRWFDALYLSTHVQEKILSQRKAHNAHAQHKYSPDHSNCLFCANPNLTLDIPEPGPTPTAPSTEAPRNSPDIPPDEDLESTMTESETVNVCEVPPSPYKRTLVVAMPNLALDSALYRHSDRNLPTPANAVSRAGLSSVSGMSDADDDVTHLATKMSSACLTVCK